MWTIGFVITLSVGATSARVFDRDIACPAQRDTEFAFTYGEPLLSYARAYHNRPSGSPVNQLFTNTALATPEQTAVVSPNVDTLYMTQCYDISRKDLVITIPEVDSSRFYSVSLYTPEGDNYLNLGSTKQTKAGRYLITPTVTSETAGKLVAGSGSAYQGTIYSPRTMGYLLIRIVLRNQDGDVGVVNEIQRGFSTRTTCRSGKPIGPELKDGLFAGNSSLKAEYLINLTARFMGTVPPTNDQPLLSAETTSKLSQAGIGNNGACHKPDPVKFEEAYTTANASVNAFMYSPQFLQDLGNGWVMPRPNLIGRYGDNYIARAAVARFGYLGLTADQAIYPIYNQAFSLGTNESYILHFAGKPPVTDIGFWSVTMYDSQGTLVPNSISRYSLGDRSNLTYPDGTSVYGTDIDAPFDILVQASQPPAKWTSNWLPSPETPGPFKIILRFYVPNEALSNGSYAYPQVSKGSAVL